RARGQRFAPPYRTRRRPPSGSSRGSFRRARAERPPRGGRASGARRRSHLGASTSRCASPWARRIAARALQRSRERCSNVACIPRRALHVRPDMPQRISPGAARRSSFAAWSCVVWGVAAWLVAGRAAAQEEPGRVEVARGALVASPRVLGLGGAYVAVAQGRDGLRHNAAAPAVRAPHSVDHVELYFGFDLQLPAVIPGADLFNDDDDEEQLDGLAILSLGAILQAGSNGFGLLAEGERFGGGGSTTGLRLSGADFGMVTLLYARGFA